MSTDNTNIINFDGFKEVGTSSNVISVSEIEVGKIYEIVTVGNMTASDFEAIGDLDATPGTVGNRFKATDVSGVGTGTVRLRGGTISTPADTEKGAVLSDNFNTWRKKTNGIVEEINSMNTDLDVLTTNAALLNRTTVQNFVSAVGGEFKDYGTMSSGNRTLDLAEANIFKFKISSSESLIISNLAASVGCSYTLIIESEGDYQINWPNEFKFVNGSGTLTKNGTPSSPSFDILKFESSGTILYSSISSYIDIADTEIMKGAATMHYCNMYNANGTTALNSSPSAANQTNAKSALGATVKVGHYVMIRFKQYYSYGTGNGTGYSYRSAYWVYQVTSLKADGTIDEWKYASAGFI